VPRGLAAALLAPLLLLLGLGFLAPLLALLATAIRDPELAATLPATRAELVVWDGQGLPGEGAFAALARESAAALADRRLGPLAARLNFSEPGLRAALLRVARAGGRLGAPYAESVAALEPRWADPATWQALAAARGPLTSLYLLRALDLTEAGANVPAEMALFRDLFARTLWVSLVVTLGCLLLAYPLAALIAGLRPPWSGIVTAMVLVPFWSSVLVRSTAWFALLAREGPVNDALLAAGLIADPLQMLGTRAAVLLATIHVLLPVAVLPLLAVMLRLDPRLPRAAASLGAGPARRFWRIWLPLTLPGVAAGGALVFLLAIGFYITPALLGGERDQLIAWFIAQFLNRDVNWGMAAALSVWLLALAGAVLGLAALLAGDAWRARR
jgi:putative spermidine/putrescine transport system permease protein